MKRHRFLPTYRYYEKEGTDSISIENSAGKPLRNYQIYGNTVDGVSCGDKTKNLLDIRKGANKTERGITYTNNGDGTITFGGTFTSTTYTYYRLIDFVTEAFEPGETYTFGCECEENDSEKAFGIMTQIKNNATGAYRYVTSYGVHEFTLAENETVTMFEFRTNLKGSVLPTVKQTVMMPYVYKGIHEPVYEPYGMYKISLKVNDDIYNLILDNPLKKKGDVADYLDFKKSQLIKITDDGLQDIREFNLPSIKTCRYKTTNIGVNTDVLPSKLVVEYYS